MRCDRTLNSKAYLAKWGESRGCVQIGDRVFDWGPMVTCFVLLADMAILVDDPFESTQDILMICPRNMVIMGYPLLRETVWSRPRQSSVFYSVLSSSFQAGDTAPAG